jgi:predicted phosphate transport protein (TIGR00153 family)
MFNVKISLFSGTRELENKIDEMHDKIIESSLYFKEAFEIYIKEKRSQNYRRASKKIKQIEAQADDLRREIESRLYAQNLIPDLRADVLQMIENIDKVINEFDEVAHKFYIEQPDIPVEYQDKLRLLINQVSECAENMAIASRAFFRDFATVRDYSKKVYFLEHESDKTWASLKQEVFDSDMELAHKLQLNSLIGEVADVADKAEDCIDAVLIFTIKRDI